MKKYSDYSFERYVSCMSDRDFDGFMMSIQRYDGYNQYVARGIDALTEPQARELHRFLAEHGAPLNYQGTHFKNIDREELACVCSFIKNRSISK